MKNSFKNTIFGLFLALCCIFALSTSSFKGVYVNATEGENEEVVEEEKEQENTEENTEEQEKEEEKTEEEKQETEENTENETTENETTEDETENTEDDEEIETEEQELGFIEENWKVLVASLLGTFGGVGGLLVFVLKAIKSSNSVIGKLKEKETEDSDKQEKLTKLSNELTEAESKLNKAISQLKEYETKFENKMEELYDLSKEELLAMHKEFEVLLKSIKLMVNNDENLVKKGIAELINKTINEKE